MSYCVNCGVELEKSQKRCPLCSTPVINPNESIEVDVVPPYPPDDATTVEKKLRHAAVLLVSIVLFVPLIICPLCNVIISGEITWSIYVILSVVYAWPIIVPPILFQNSIFNKCVWIDFFSTLIFLKVLNAITTPEINWFLNLSLPIMIYIMIALYVNVFIYRRTRHILTVISASLILAGFMSIIVEYLILSFKGSYIYFVWSVPTAISCISLAAVILVVSHITKLKLSFKKRMHI